MKKDLYRRQTVFTTHESNVTQVAENLSTAIDQELKYLGDRYYNLVMIVIRKGK